MQTKATRENVFAAADGLAASGRPTTVDAIIEVVGGSKTTVIPLLAEWREVTQKNRGAGNPPERVTSLLQVAAQNAWAIAHEEASQLFAGQRAEHDAAITTMEGQNELCRARIAELEAQVGDLTHKVTLNISLESKLRTAEHAVERMRINLDRARLDLDASVAEERRQRERAAVAEAAMRRAELQLAAERASPADQAAPTLERKESDGTQACTNPPSQVE